MAGALVWAKTSKELAGQYDRLVADMVCASTDKVTAYSRSVLMFESLLEEILANIPDRCLALTQSPRGRPAQGLGC